MRTRHTASGLKIPPVYPATLLADPSKRVCLHLQSELQKVVYMTSCPPIRCIIMHDCPFQPYQPLHFHIELIPRAALPLSALASLGAQQVCLEST